MRANGDNVMTKKLLKIAASSIEKVTFNEKSSCNLGTGLRGWLVAGSRNAFQEGEMKRAFVMQAEVIYLQINVANAQTQVTQACGS